MRDAARAFSLARLETSLSLNSSGITADKARIRYPEFGALTFASREPTCPLPAAAANPAFAGLGKPRVTPFSAWVALAEPPV